MTSSAFIHDCALKVELMRGTGSIFALTLTGCTMSQRMTMLDHHDAVRRLLRQRGHQVRANVVYDENGVETITLRIVDGSSWQTLDG